MYNYYDAGPYHAVDRIDDFDRFDYDANGNMTKRNKGLASQQTLVWDAENRLSQVQDNNGDMVEQYWYGVEGMRVKKTRGSTTTYTFFAQYEEEVTDGVTTVVSYYTFGSMRVAVKRGSTLYHLHGDHLGSTSLTTAGSAVEASRAYYAYGAERSATGDLKTDHTFTGQKRDATGLMYYNARYYDPALGTFISPDSMVPGAGQVINYNRFLYARGNPLKYTDPTGHAGYDPTGSAWVQEFKDNHQGRAPTSRDRFDRSVSLIMRGPASGSRTWTDRDWKQNAITPVLTPEEVRDLAGIIVDSSWKPNHAADLDLLTEGVLWAGGKLGTPIGGSAKEGLAHLKTLSGGGVTWFRKSTHEEFCPGIIAPLACTEPEGVYFFDSLFAGHSSTAQGAAIHELAHVIQNTCYVDCQLISDEAEGFHSSSTKMWNLIRQHNFLTGYAAFGGPKQYWAEAVTVWVLGPAYPGVPSDINERGYISDIYGWVEEVLNP